MYQGSVSCGFGKLSSGWNSAAASKHTPRARSERCVNQNLQRHTSTLFRTQYNRFISDALAELLLHKKQCGATEGCPIFILCVAVKLQQGCEITVASRWMHVNNSTRILLKGNNQKGPAEGFPSPMSHLKDEQKLEKKQRNKFPPCWILH